MYVLSTQTYHRDRELWNFHSPTKKRRFGPHQSIIARNRRDQDYLWNSDLHLQSLNEYNLDAFPLLGSEGSLLETMWTREYIFQKAVAVL